MGETANIQLERVNGLTRRGAFTVAGVKNRFSPSNMHEIPALWSRLVPRLPLPGSKHGTLGLILPDDEEGFVYIAGVEMDDGAPVPDDLDKVEIPAQAYAVYRLTVSGEALQPQMQAAIHDIWGRRLGAEGLTPTRGPNFELYPPYFDQAKAGGTLEFWIPVEG